jgi:hypothetical protein
MLTPTPTASGDILECLQRPEKLHKNVMEATLRTVKNLVKETPAQSFSEKPHPNVFV